ncbi:adenylate/guanylate cyclase domain-containing protein [Prosthecomicrobium sp. N25]|uniref:adenylate/guanylate cyclase domain-containing protein n=1 Tax=Prosthecomicrobium sp. N25 TaxID=3129254 RepID=UPI0030778302
MPSGRKLAAILAADVVGFSRLAGLDEERTLARLRTLRSDLVDPTIQVHGGRVVKRTGDGAIVEFRSAVDAVRCAIEIQTAMVERNAGVPEDRRIEFRIGIHIGDVVEETDGDLMGDGVNIAARLEGVAAPGSVCLSEDAYRQVRSRIDFALVDLGETRLKNIADPVRIYGLDTSGRRQPSPPPQTPALPGLPNRPSIAVLPFANMSNDPEQDYFAQGIAEDIITGLSRFKRLFVIARNSSFSYKGRAVNLGDIGRELGVRYVLEGSVRKSGSRLRITAQLVEAATGVHLWADRFDGELADVFDLQDQVTSRVVATIAPRLEHAEMDRVLQKPTESLDAYDHFLRGLSAFHRFSSEANTEALESFRKAGALDPGYACAHGMAARCYGQRRGFGWTGAPATERLEALRLARLATALGSDDAVALAAAGFAFLIFGEIEDGASQIERAQELNPNLAWAKHMGALAEVLLGRPERAIELASEAMRLSPQDPQAFGTKGMMGLANYCAGRFAEAYRWSESSLGERPNFFVSACVSAAAAAMMGAEAERDRALGRLLAARPGIRLADAAGWLDFRSPEHRQLWRDGLKAAGLPD